MYGGFDDDQIERARRATGANRSPIADSTRSATPLRSAFLRAIAAASGDSSVATTRAAGSSFARLIAIAPEPVHRSSTRHGAARSARSAARDLDHRLGVGPRHEHARVDVERQPPELVLAEQVRDRLAAEPALDQLAIAGELASASGLSKPV